MCRQPMLITEKREFSVVDINNLEIYQKNLCLLLHIIGFNKVDKVAFC